MPPLSDYDVTLHGVTRTGRRRFVVLHGECTAGRATAPPPRWTAPVDVPAPAGSGEACWFDAAFDPQAHRFTWLALGRYKPSSPADPLDCARAPFQAVDHLADLPADIADALRSPSDLADHGAEFQHGDIGLLTPEPLFSRRFALAAIAGDRAFVAVEHGGELPETKVWSFERRNGH